MSNFSFSHHVFNPFGELSAHLHENKNCRLQTFSILEHPKFVVWKRVKGLINPFPNKPWFLRVCSTFFENTVGKGEFAHNEQFLLFPQGFLPI